MWPLQNSRSPLRRSCQKNLKQPQCPHYQGWFDWKRGPRSRYPRLSYAQILAQGQISRSSWIQRIKKRWWHYSMDKRTYPIRMGLTSKFYFLISTWRIVVINQYTINEYLINWNESCIEKNILRSKLIMNAFDYFKKASITRHPFS